MEYELTISKQTDHFNGKHWFVIQEMETSEEIGDDHSCFEEAEHALRKIIAAEPKKYFTKLELATGYYYRLSRLKGGSDRYGDCESCNKHVDSMYMLVEERRYWSVSNLKESLTFNGCNNSIFGHKDCLSKRTEMRAL
ncbi:MAG: hypothetical protein HAW67_00165 [Endozoicomonadaceae bacterium]|nr:hypothetical protein [Endozoicomonadaceae bacterium]